MKKKIRRNMESIVNYSNKARRMKKLDAIICDKGKVKKIVTALERFSNMDKMCRRRILADTMCMSSKGFFTSIMSNEGIDFIKTVMPLIHENDYIGRTSEETACKLRMLLSIIAANVLDEEFEQIPTDRPLSLATHLQFEARDVSVITEDDIFDVGVLTDFRNRFIVDAFNPSNKEHEIHIPMSCYHARDKVSTIVSKPFIMIFGDKNRVSSKVRLDEIPTDKVYYSYLAEYNKKECTGGITAFMISSTKLDTSVQVSDDRIIIRYKD